MGGKSRVQNTKLKTNLIATVWRRSGLQLFFLNIRDVARSWPSWERCITSDMLGFNYRGFGRWNIIPGNRELTGQATYIKCKIKALSYNYLCRGKAISIQYCECVCVLLLYLSDMQMHFFCAVLYCHLWPVWLYHIFPHYLINGMIFRKQ